MNGDRPKRPTELRRIFKSFAVYKNSLELLQVKTIEAGRRRKHNSRGSEGGKIGSREIENKMKNRQIDKKLTFQVRIDRGWQRILTQLRADTRMTIKSLVEAALSETYTVDSNGQPVKVKK